MEVDQIKILLLLESLASSKHRGGGTETAAKMTDIDWREEGATLKEKQTMSLDQLDRRVRENTKT